MAFFIWTKRFVFFFLLFCRLTLGESDQVNHTLVSVQELSGKVQDLKSFLSHLELLMKIADMESTSRLEPRLEQLEQSLNHTLDLFAGPPSMDGPRVQAYCKDGWKYFGDSCYLFSYTRGSWEDGRQDCLAMGADYVKITSLEEFNFCASQMKFSSWIGLKRDGGRKYRWISDGKEETNSRNTWWSTQRGSQDCVYFYHASYEYNWKTEYCGNSYWYICEKVPSHHIAYP